MRRCGLIGNPVEHSLSPVMQTAAFRETGIGGSYELWPTTDSEVPARVAELREPDVLGANVTVPHKQQVMPEIDEISETARRIGAVNTIINRGGHLVGDNTDAYGFARVVASTGFGASPESRALVLGAGGAARAVIVALQQAGFGTVEIANRTPERAATLARELDREGTVSPVLWGDLETVLSSVDLLVNATSLGWHVGELPLDIARLGLLSERATVVDLTYRDTDLLQVARRRGLMAVDGLGMLIHQGARAFELWTGVEAPVEAMRAAVEIEQRGRAGMA
ncbi:MAG TPA: shikimate dehydrogenase [Thermomicrobiales bacterium]|nr:shikimate dehydrogenase [Thermomicrobiales bacterium]